MTKPADIAPHLTAMPEERREAARAHIALVTATVRQCAMTVPLSADIDDHRRILAAHAPKAGK